MSDDLGSGDLLTVTLEQVNVSKIFAFLYSPEHRAADFSFSRVSRGNFLAFVKLQALYYHALYCTTKGGKMIVLTIMFVLIKNNDSQSSNLEICFDLWLEFVGFYNTYAISWDLHRPLKILLRYKRNISNK